MKFLALITARGGSKRLKNKNLILLNKKPLIYWSINFAKKIKEIKDVVISTDSKTILDKSNKYGVKTKWLRPKKLALSNTTSEAVVKHAYLKEKKNGLNVDAIILLQPTSPFRDIKVLKKALKLFIKDPSIPLVSVSKLRHPSKLLLANNKRLSLFKLNKPAFIPNGSIFILKAEQALSLKNYLGGKVNYIELQGIKQNIDIDTILDLKLAKILFNIKI
jgi:CMP-N,N'-diacetyllegionaminic acid synthase